MFSNQISTKDLYISKENQDNVYSTERDFSQLQNAQFTQFDNSQCSQDFFSQTQCSSGSSESQGRKLQLFEKYMAKPSLFRSNSQGRNPVNRPCSSTSQFSSKEPQQTWKQQSSYQQQLTINKNRAKERDERDMLNSIVHIVKECSDEVKQGLHILTDGCAENTDKLKSTILSLTDQMKESTDKIMKSIQSREEQVSLVEKLQHQLHEKEEKIQELLKLQNGNNIQESSRCMIEALKNFMNDQRNEMEKRLQKLFEATQEELKLLKEHISAQRNSSDENSKNLQDMKYTTNRQIQDVEKRVVDELLHIRDDFERQKRDMENFYKNQLQMMQQKQTREITQYFERGLENISRTSTDFDLLERQTEVITDICRSQQKDLVSTVRNVAAEQSKQYLRQNQDLYSSHQKNLANELDQKFEDLKTSHKTELQAVADYFDKNWEEKSVSWKNDMVPKKVQAQLDELHNQHLSEIKRLEQQIEDQKKKTDEAAKSESDQQSNTTGSVLQNVYDLQFGDQRKTENKDRAQVSLFNKASGFVSPRPLVGTRWNSRAIFGRTNPSPVATVLPQRKSKEDDRNTVHNVDGFMQQENNMQSAEHPIQPPRQTNREDHVVPSTPQGAREIVQQSLVGLIEASNSQSASECDLQLPVSAQTPKKTAAAKKGSKKRGKRKQKFTVKKTKAKLKTYEQHEKVTKTHGSIIRSTQALAVYDFADEASPDQVKRKSRTFRQIDPPLTSLSELVMPAACSGNEPAIDNNQDVATSALPHMDVFLRRKLCQMERKPQVKPGSANSSEEEDLPCQEDLLSTPNLMNKKSPAFEALNICQNRKSLDANKNVRRFEPKRRLCDFDTQIVNLLECIQKKKRFNT